MVNPKPEVKLFTKLGICNLELIRCDLIEEAKKKGRDLSSFWKLGLNWYLNSPSSIIFNYGSCSYSQ
jgi:hypothetical protein